MSGRTRKHALGLALTLALVVPAAMGVMNAIDSPRMNTRAVNWVLDLTPEERLAAAADIASLPDAYRRALYSTLPGHARVEVWRVAVRRYISAHPDLLPESKQALEVFAALVTPAVVTRAASATEIATLERAAERVRTLMPLDGRALTSTLGPADNTRGVAEPWRQRLVGWVANRLTLSASAAAADCECATGSDWCYYLWSCSAGYQGCSTVETQCIPIGEGGSCIPVVGCGTLLAYDCNGGCRFFMMD